MAKKQFKAESKKLLDLMIHSIYTNKEIFLRELISNSSDALDKLYYKSLTSGELGIKRNDFYIQITPDKELRTLTIRDNGIGMSKDELENNLGTIAKSGSLGFKEEQEKNKDENTKAKNIDIIGQFGVGFYSAFMVSDIVSVTSKAFGSDEASLDGHGTEIVLTIKEDTDGENYSSFLEEYTIRNLIKKYSDYIRYPIRMMVEKSRPVGETEEGKAPEFEKYSELETLNSMEPIWKRQKSKVKPEEYNDYYKSKYMDYMDPARVIRTNVEGVSSFTALMFIPGHAPFDYYTKEYEKGLQLYSSGVMIMDKCKDLLPDYFNFVKGLVDSQDLSLNISREMLQQDRQLKNIAKNVEKKIKRDLEDFLKNDRDGYEKFFENFGKQLKYGLYESYGMNREVLEDLVLFYSSTEQKNVTLAEYLERMKDDQNAIYYAAGESIKKIDLLPQTEFVKSKGYEILYLTDEMDEFVFNILGQYKDKPFKSVSAEDIAEDDTEEAKENMKKLEEDNKELLEDIKNALGDKVSEVKLSPRLKSSAVCLTTKGDISLEMEKILSAMPMDQGIKAERVLELNPEHSVFEALNKIKSDDADGKKLEVYANLLYDQALLISGLQIDDPVEFSKSICELIVDAN